MKKLRKNIYVTIKKIHVQLILKLICIGSILVIECRRGQPLAQRRHCAPLPHTPFTSQ